MNQARLVALSKLKPWPENPRTIDEDRLDQLKRSLEQDAGMLEVRPLVALPDGTVIMGNQRLAAAVALGWEKIPVATVNLDPATARSWAIRDNQSYGEWDEEALGAMALELREDGLDLSMLGFGRDELDDILARGTPLPPPEPMVDPIDPPENPESVLGEVYELGPHRVICGDATDPAVLVELMGGALAEMLWTDPPYGVSYESVGRVEKAKRDGTTKAAAGVKPIANDGEETLGMLLRGAFAACDAVMEPNARFYVAAPAGPMGSVFRAALITVGWDLHEVLVWVKDRMVMGHSDYHYRHEDVLYGWKPGSGRAGRGNHAGSRWYGDHSQTTVFDIPRPARSDEHPTMKPVELVRRMLENSSRRRDAVLDPFGGSGTTLIAAHETGRRCFMAELDPRYVDVIRARYARLVEG